MGDEHGSRAVATNRMDDRVPGVLLGLASAALFGASTPQAKLLLGEVDPWLLAGLLYLGSGIGLGIVHLGRRTLGNEPPEAPLRRADLPWLAAVVLAGGVIGPVLLMLGLSVIPASSAALLLNVEGLATMGREAASRRSFDALRGRGVPDAGGAAAGELAGAGTARDALVHPHRRGRLGATWS